MNIKGKLIIYIVILIIFSFTFFTFVLGADTTGKAAFVNIINPFNNTVDLDGNITFSYNVTNSTYQIDNCSLIFNGIINQTDTNITESTQYFYLYNLNDGNHNWSVNCTNSIGNETMSETRNLEVFVDTTPPTVTLNSPVNGATDTDGNAVFNYTVTDNGWVTSCDLYTDMNGTWQINQTNIFVQENFSIYFEVNNIPDDIIFKWNVLCYDFALTPNSDWANSNWTLTVNNSAPTYSTVPNQEWNEDTSHTINLSNYFSDPDGDALTYTSTSLSNISISIDNATGIVTLNPDLNWHGQETIIFYAFDIRWENATSNTVTLTVNPGSDDTPRITFASPLNNSIDNDGYIFFNCSAFDDYNLVNVSLYTNISGIWEINQTKSVSGNYDSALFNLTALSDGSYNWNCLVSDNASQSAWGEDRIFNVDIIAELDDDISNFTINHIDHNKTILVSYSNYLDDSLFLGDLTIYLSNGSIYFTKNMSDNEKFEINSTDPPLNVYAEKIRIKYDEIFYGNFTIGNQEWLNISLDYYYQNNIYQTSTKHTIEVKSALPT